MSEREELANLIQQRDSLDTEIRQRTEELDHKLRTQLAELQVSFTAWAKGQPATIDVATTRRKNAEMVHITFRGEWVRVTFDHKDGPLGGGYVYVTSGGGYKVSFDPEPVPALPVLTTLVSEIYAAALREEY